MNKIYVQPIPIKTFPLPTFYPNNPISLFHLVYAWVSEVLRPPPSEPSVVHVGVWDPETRSVHVKDDASIRALWEHGFFGKGSLSRSEPNWLKRELARRGSPEGKTVSEARTELRREERRLAKWERAKAELEAIEKQRLAEAAARAAAAEPEKLNGHANGHVTGPVETLALPESVEAPVPETDLMDAVAEVIETTPAPEAQQILGLNRLEEIKPPVGPLELLALPNSSIKPIIPLPPLSVELKPPVGPLELLVLPNSLVHAVLGSSKGTRVTEAEEVVVNEQAPQTPQSPQPNGQSDVKAPQMNGDISINGHAEKPSAIELVEVPANASRPNGSIEPVSASPAEDNASPPLKHRKSVRFSPTVESTTFLHSDPPSPNRSGNGASKDSILSPPNGEAVPEPSESTSDQSLAVPVGSTEIENKEHYQLAPEEAFFLVFSLGALSVVDPVTGSPISTEQLLNLFRSYSYFPPRAVGSPSLGPDDPFLVNYAVYHHFRSLGWVPRHGIKFGVDWILYQRGPVFDHSEFGLMVMPAFSDPQWKEHEHEEHKRSWSWLMGVNRVLSHVLKSLVLVYVDIPPPAVFEECMRRGGIAEALKKYDIREVMVRRFSVNRNR